MKKSIYEPAYRKVIEDLRRTRLNLHMKQEEVGKRMGVTRHWIRKVEICELRLDIVQFVRICRIYRLDTTRLLRRVEEETPEEGDPLFIYQLQDLRGASHTAESMLFGACLGARRNSCYVEFGNPVMSILEQTRGMRTQDHFQSRWGAIETEHCK
jgi:transcriptional regulator with XRE-family HTH domain